MLEMPPSPQPITVLEFLDPEMLTAAIRNADLEACQLSAHPAPSMIARVRCPRICLDLASVGPAMLYHGVMPRDCFTLSFVAACPGEGHSFNFNTGFSAGYLGFFPPGAPLDATSPGGSIDAILTVPVAEFHAALAIHFPEIPDRVLARGAGMRVGEAEQPHLRRVLNGIGDAIQNRGGQLADEMSCCQLEQVLLPAFIGALRSGCDAIVPLPTERVANRYRRLRQACEFIHDHMHGPDHEAIHVGDICSELGLSERGVENLFRDFVGIGPASLLRHQRHHCVHRRLLSGDPVPGAVKRAALEFGFRHLGRFACDYRRLFGENPSETLARTGVSQLSP